MQPIIINMNDMSESTEVYESKANPFLVYTIYCIFLLMIFALIWMCFFKLDVVVKSNGMFQCDESIYELSSGIAGEISSCNVKEGQYVKKGDILYTVHIEALNETMKEYKSNLKDVNQRIEILNAYIRSLEGDNILLDSLKENKYYKEFIDKRKLLLANIDVNVKDIDSQKTAYQENIDSITKSIRQNKDRLNKLSKVKKCITAKKNVFNKNESYYRSIVDSYITNYKLTKNQYNNQLKTYKEQIKICNKSIRSSQNLDNTSLLTEKKSIVLKIKALRSEKKQALINLEQQQIASIEQQIVNINDTISTLEANLTSVCLERDSVKATDTSVTKNIIILTEKEKMITERHSYEEKCNEYENYIKKYRIQYENCNIVANSSGYVYLNKNLKKGSYVQEGESIGKIYPKEVNRYYAEIYVENSDIGKLEIGQQVNFEVPAYPSEEYGYFTGTIYSIPKDIKIDETSGSAYYIVRVKCNNIILKNKSGKKGTIMNGMACQAKVIVDEEKIIRSLLRKINLLD